MFAVGFCCLRALAESIDVSLGFNPLRFGATLRSQSLRSGLSLRFQPLGFSPRLYFDLLSCGPGARVNQLYLAHSFSRQDTIHNLLQVPREVYACQNRLR